MTELSHLHVFGESIPFDPVHMPDRMTLVRQLMPMYMDIGNLWHPATREGDAADIHAHCFKVAKLPGQCLQLPSRFHKSCTRTDGLVLRLCSRFVCRLIFHRESRPADIVTKFDQGCRGGIQLGCGVRRILWYLKAPEVVGHGIGQTQLLLQILSTLI